MNPLPALLLGFFAAASPVLELEREATVAAQDPWELFVPPTRNFRMADGLPENYLAALAQDRDGFLWIGSQDGAVRFDGREWRTIRMPGPQTSNYVNSLLVSAMDDAWFGTWGSGLFHLTGGTWRHFDEASGQLPSDVVQAVIDAGSGAVLVATGKGAARIDAQGEVHRIGPSTAVNALLALPDGRVLFGTDKGLSASSGEPPLGVPEERVWSLHYSARTETIWIGTESGLFAAQRGAATRAPLSLQQVSSISELDNELWVGSFAGAVAVQSENRWKLYTATTGVDMPAVRAVLAVRSYHGRTIVWIATDGGGLVRMIVGGLRVPPLQVPELRRMTHSIVDGEEPGVFWVGTDSRLVRIAPGKVQIYRYRAPYEVGPAFALFRSSGPALLATKFGDLVTLRAPFAADPSFRHDPFDTVFSIGGTMRRLLVGRRSGVVFREHATDQGGEGHDRSAGEAAGLKATPIFSVATVRWPDETTPETWAGGNSGLAIEADGAWTAVETAEGLPNPIVNALATFATPEGATREVWVGTAGGAARVTQRNGRREWQTFSMGGNPPVPITLVNALAGDAQGGMYVMTNRGVVRLARGDDDRYAWQSYTSEDGLAATQTVFNAAFIDPSGRVWIGTEGGLSVFDPKAESNAAPRFEPLISEAVVSGTSLEVSDGMVLSHRQTHVTFGFTLPNLFRSAETRFRTELEGLDEHPSDWVAESRREFTNLPPGTYEFRVWASDYAQRELGPARRRFHVRPAPWRTWWAMVGYFACAAGIVYGGTRARVRQLERRAEALELVVHKRTEEVRNQASEILQQKNALEESYKQADRIFSQLKEALKGSLVSDRYKLEEEIGHGGFGVVYRATEVRTGEALAVKVFRPSAGNDSMESLERFKLEAKTSMGIDHPNVVRIKDSGVSSENVAYLVMELLHGHSLRQEITDRQRLHYARAALVGRDICLALECAHGLGIVHRDIKPENIFLHQGDDGREVVKVLDFGVAKLQNPSHSMAAMQSLTMTGAIVGTPTYIAPERIEDLAYDGRADIYSVGVMLYEMIAGKPPFSSEQNSIFSVVMKHLNEAPKPLLELTPEVPEALARCIDRALAKTAADRPTAAELARDLAAAVDATHS